MIINMIKQAITLPALCLAIGLVLIFFNQTEIAGNFLIPFSFLTFIYKLLVHGFQYYENKLLESHSIASLIFKSVRKSLLIIYLLAIIHIMIMVIPSKSSLVIANEILQIFIICALGWLAIQILYTLEAIIFQQTIKLAEEDRHRGQKIYTKTHILRNIATVIVILLTLATILMSFSPVRSIGISLLASAGFLTAIIGFACQKPLSTIFSGLQIALAQVVKIGDSVIIENQSGVIEEISFTHVKMLIKDGRRMIVPINYFTDKHFILDQDSNQV